MLGSEEPSGRAYSLERCCWPRPQGTIECDTATQKKMGPDKSGPARCSSWVRGVSDDERGVLPNSFQTAAVQAVRRRIAVAIQAAMTVAAMSAYSAATKALSNASTGSAAPLANNSAA